MILLYANIVELCKGKGISISKLEKECGLGNATIQGWKNGNPRVDKLMIVADYFGVSLDYLLRPGD